MKTLCGLFISLLVCLTAFPSWAAIVYVGARTFSTVGVTSVQNVALTSLTGGTDTAPLAGDFVVVAWCVSGNATPDRALTIKTPGGTDYTLIGSELFANDGNTTNLRVAYMVMPGTPETSVDLSEVATGGTGALTDGGTASIFVLRGVHATPLEQAAQQAAVLNTMIVNPGSITPTTAGTIIFVVGCGSNSIGAVYTSSDLTDFRSSTIADSTDSNIGAGYLAWTAGSFDPATWGGGGTDGVSMSNAWTVVAFAPAAEAAGSSDVNNCGALMLLGVRGC